RSATELDRQLREQALRAALAGDSPAEQTRTRLALPARPRLTLLGLAQARDHPLEVRLGPVVARHWAAVTTEAAVTTVNRTAYVLLPASEPETARRLAEQAVAALDRTLAAPVRCALSRTTADAADLPALRAEVDDVLRVTTAADGPPVAALADVHSAVLLAHLSDELARRPALRHPGIDAMTDHDRTRRTQYAATVTAWLDAAGNIGEAARCLAVHPNTLKYRLRRVRELFGVDVLGHPDDRLSCWLQLRLRQPPV
ncbi:PucR family transcriptional regulator, partial [Crossiella equi]